MAGGWLGLVRCAASGLPGALGVRLPADGAPLDPSSTQARDWVRQELSKGKYHTAPSLWERFVDWLRGLLGTDGGRGGGLPSWGTTVVVILVLLLVAAIVVRLVRREARTRPVGEGPVLDEPGVSSQEYRRRAAAAVAGADWDGAVLDGYRAIVQGSVERALLDDLPGRTADEVAVELAPVFPSSGDDLRHAAAAFDAVRYGHLAAHEPAARAVLALEERLRRDRPVLPGLTAVSGMTS